VRYPPRVSVPAHVECLELDMEWGPAEEAQLVVKTEKKKPTQPATVVSAPSASPESTPESTPESDLDTLEFDLQLPMNLTLSFPSSPVSPTHGQQRDAITAQPETPVGFMYAEADIRPHPL
jgi:hypothetical protein